MTPERWRAITEIFHGAIARDAAARGAFLADACKEDASLRAEVEAMIAAHGEAGSFGNASALPSAIKQLTPGTPLGVYRIEALIGAGGMGEVYRARDMRLERTVAIKILPPHLRASADRQARFEREARMISRLTHPHICTLHDIGSEGDTDFLVMEHLEGETLAARLARGRVPLAQALQIGTEIAAALDHAHRHGIVHRDLKPSNVMLTKSGAKLLDFGLAKLAPSMATGASEVANAPTVQTAEGTLVGTLAYMAPEQLEGKEADARADIWALGCVLYELVTGQRPFDGASQASLIAAILEHEPAPATVVQPVAPPLLDHIIRTCLAKDPEERWQSAADVKRELGWIRDGARLTGSSGDVRRTLLTPSRRAFLIGAAAMLLAVSVTVSWFAASRFRAAPAVSPSARLSIPLAESGLTLVPAGLAVSPDGQSIVFVAKGNGESRLYLRRLTDSAVRPLAGTDRGSVPFFSPDGEWLGFVVVNDGIFKVPITGGPVERVYSNTGQLLGATWDTSGQIVFGIGASKLAAGLWSVPARGGAAQPVARAEATGAIAYAAPNVLPGGEAFLFTIRKGGVPRIGALMGRSGEVRGVIDAGTRPWYVPTGHLLYESAGHLRAVSFDLDRLQPRGESRVVVEGLAADQAGIALYAVSSTGTLAYISASSVLKRLVWMDRAGAKTRLPFEPHRYSSPELSPDGRTLAVTIEEGATRNVWAGSVDSGTLTRLTFGNNDVYSTFPPDSKNVLFTAEQDGRYNVFSTPTNGGGAPVRVTDSPHAQRVTSMSPDGKVMLLNDMGEATAQDILQMDVGRPESIKPFIKTSFKELGGHFSRDGRWVAYMSDESGRFEVYVTAYPGAGVKRRVSLDGGQWPVWNPPGDELVYQGPGALMSVAIADGVAVRPPVKLFTHTPTTGLTRDWTISADGLRFLVVDDTETKAASQINVVLNFFEDLKARVPAAK